MNFKPLGNRLVIQKIEDEEIKTESGIIISGGGALAPKFFKVLKIADNVSSVKEGDEIMISIVRSPILIEGIECIIITEDEVVGIK